MYATTTQTEISCPVCHTDIKLELTIETKEVDVKIMKAWSKFLVWKLCGEPKYREEQWWYDDYHNGVRFESDNKSGCGTVYFSIQVFDSPEGDTWLHAKVPLRAGRLRLNEKEVEYSSTCYYHWKKKKEAD
jgi:hypothetical protein